MKANLIPSFLTMLGWIAIFFPRMLIPPLLPFIEEEFGISHTLSSLLMSIYLFSYGLMQFPSGILNDRYGYRFLLIFSMIGTSLSSFLIFFSYSFNHILILRLFGGLLSGTWYVSSTYFLSSSSSSSKLGYSLGLSFSGVSCGSILIYIVLYLFANYMDNWRLLFVIASIPGIINACLIYILTKKDYKISELNKKITYQIFKYMNIKTLFVLTLNFISSFIMWGYTTFIPTYLLVGKRFSFDYVSIFLLVQSLISIVGNLCTGYIINKLNVNLSLMVLLIISNISPILLQFTNEMTAILFLLGVQSFFSGWFICLTILIINLSPQNLKGTFLGLSNTLTFFSGTCASFFFGFILDVGGFNLFFIAAGVSMALSITLFLTYITKLKNW
ncbi:MAG: MFS transporter [Nitrososphaeria archaeon]